jgi:hypothetical protein
LKRSVRQGPLVAAECLQHLTKIDIAALERAYRA